MSKCGSSEEEEEESPISLDSDEGEYQDSDTPSDSSKPKMPRTKSTGPLPGRHPRRSPPTPNARQPGSRSRVVVVGPIKGEEVRSA